MQDSQDHFPFPGQLPHNTSQPSAPLCILRNGGLIQNHHLRFHGKHGCDGHHFPVRQIQVIGILALHRRQSYCLQCLDRALPGISLTHPQVYRSHHDLVQHAVLKYLVIRILEHVPDPARQTGHGFTAHVLSLKQDPSAVRFQKPFQQLDKGGLSRAVLPYDGGWPLVQFQVQRLDDRSVFGVGKSQVLYGEHGDGARYSFYIASCIVIPFDCAAQLSRKPFPHRLGLIQCHRITIPVFHGKYPCRLCIHRWFNTERLQVLPGKYMLRAVKCNLFSLMQQQQTAAVSCQLFHLVLHHDDGNSRPGQAVHHPEHFLAALGIQLGGRFV